jgi:hypothetical protein
MKKHVMIAIGSLAMAVTIIVSESLAMNAPLQVKLVIINVETELMILVQNQAT